jgi:hypothetical protein
MTYAVLADANLIGLTWFGVPTLEGVRELEVTFARVAAAQPRKIAFATRIQAERPDKAAPEVRTAMAKLLQRYAPQLCATVVIYESGGFRAAALRAIITTINIVSRTEFPSQVHANLQQGVAWLVQQMGAEQPGNAQRRLLSILPAHPPQPAQPQL